ncbi:transmembrane protein, putative, partial (macronuclear) [Tetrahymena thermophila SB210]
LVIYQLTCLFTYQPNKIQRIYLLTHHNTTKILTKAIVFLQSFLLHIYLFNSLFILIYKARIILVHRVQKIQAQEQPSARISQLQLLNY